jgi:hypothetical protein
MISKIVRVDYNPANKNHRDSLFKFITEAKWDSYFNIKYPYKELPYQLYLETLKYYREQELLKG